MLKAEKQEHGKQAEQLDVFHLTVYSRNFFKQL